MDQLSLFPLSPTPYSLQTVKHDRYWDEITKEPEEKLLMVSEECDTANTISNSPADNLLMVSEQGEIENTISKRPRGDGTGRITKRTISKNGRDYKQYWYDWQYIFDGKLVGRSRYIPKRLLSQVQALEQEKVAVAKIIALLGVSA